MSPDRNPYDEAAALARAGHRDEAIEILTDVLKVNPNDLQAWKMMVRLARTPSDARDSLKQVLRLDPGNQRARELLAQLEATPHRKKRGVPLLWLLPAALVLIVLVLLAGLFLLRQRQPGVIESAAQPGNPAEEAILQEVLDLPGASCRELVSRALDVSSRNCDRIGANEVCYGNDQVDATLNSGLSEAFDLVGDIIAVAQLQTLTASPLSLDQQEWGVAVFRLQADLERTVPGQVVTFLVFGDTELGNNSGDLRAFTFSTGLGAITCSEVPADGILIDMPDGASITFEANGSMLNLSGTAALSARPNDEMTVSIYDGRGVISSNGVLQVVEAGQQSSIPLGGEDGLSASGPPGPAQPLSYGSQGLTCLLSGQNCPPELAAAGMGDPVSTSTPEGSETPDSQATPTLTRTPLGNRPTNTPRPGETAAGPATTTTATARPGTATPTPRPGTATPTLRPGEPTYTPQPASTRTPSPAPGAPTSTRTPSPAPATPANTVAPSATHTAVPPTHTPVTPTDTLAPVETPTNTLPAPSCSNIQVVAGGAPAEFNITNQYGSTIVLTQITLDWPGSNGQMKMVKLGTAALDAGNLGGPPLTLNLTAAIDKRTILNGVTQTLTFTFDNAAAGSGYTLSVTFDVGCFINSSQ